MLFCYLDLTEVLASPPTVGEKRRFLPGCAVLLLGPYWTFGQPTIGEKRRFFTWQRCSATWNLLKLWPALSKGKKGGFYLTVLFCYLDLTKVLASSRKGDRGGFYLPRCSDTWISLSFWPAHERGKEEVFTWQCCSANWTLLRFCPAHIRGKERFLPDNAFLFCYLGLTEVLASPLKGKKEVFTCSAVLLPGSHWSFGQPTEGENRSFLPGCAVLLPGSY